MPIPNSKTSSRERMPKCKCGKISGRATPNWGIATISDVLPTITLRESVRNDALAERLQVTTLHDMSWYATHLALMFFDHLIVLTNIIITPYFIFNLWTTRLIHVNQRLATLVNFVPLVLLGVMRMVVELVDLVDPTISVFCTIFGPPIVFFTSAGQPGLAFIFIERLRATLFSDGYEKRSALFGIIGILICSLWGCVFTVTVILYRNIEPHAWPTYEGSCVPNYHKPLAFVIGWYVYAVCTFPCLPAVVYLHKYNKQKAENQKSTESLSAKYQYNENAKVLQSLLPAYQIHGGIIGNFGLAAVFYATYSLARGFEVDDAMILAMRVSVQFGLYFVFLAIVRHVWAAMHISMDSCALFFALIFTAYHPVLRDRFRKDFHKLTRKRVDPQERFWTIRETPAVNSAEEGEYYFKTLASSWQ